MESRIFDSIKLTNPPVALLWSDEKPDAAKEFKEGKWGCVMWLLASAAKGRTAVFSDKTVGCFGGGVGLGFGDHYQRVPGGIEIFYYFLSTGNENWEHGRKVCEQIKPFLRDEQYEHFMHGERYVKTPELVEKFVKILPITQIPKKYVVFKPLTQIDPDRETPEVIIFFADPDQFSALSVLANYGREDNENVIMPMAAGCQLIGIYPYQEARKENPRAVAGLTDLSAREHINRQLGPNLLTFAVPFKMFLEMENNVEGSFIQMRTWQKLCDFKYR